MDRFVLPQVTGRRELASQNGNRLHHRATTLLRHYPQGAVSEAGREIARTFLTTGADRAALSLETLSPHIFSPYVPGLLHRTAWSPETWSAVLQSVSVFESMLGCVHACKMCYIDAPPAGSAGFMPWPHMQEVLNVVADERRRILRDELVEVLVNDLLRGRLKPPVSHLDAAFALVRHARNRFSNYSDHLLCYWKSNPTNWSDPLFARDYSDICEEVVRAFQLFQIDELMKLVDRDPLSQKRFKDEFGEDAGRVAFAASMHAVTSSVPVAEGSIGDRAIRRILAGSPLGSELIRVSIPHPNLIRTGTNNPGRYWAAVRHSLRIAMPKLVYVFATTVDELQELVQNIADTFEHSDLPWWIESRLAVYEIREGRKRSETDQVIVERLRRVLKKLCFTAKLEGRGKQFDGSPLFKKGSVMCVNGVVIAPNRELHYQACTTPAGEDLEEGIVIENLEALGEDAVLPLVSGRPHTNRSRELVTKGLAAIPLHERRKPWAWFAETVRTNKLDTRYAEAALTAQRVSRELFGALRL